MGFGLICAGYLTLLFFRTVPAELFGFIAICKGLSKLSQYNNYFKTALYTSFVIVAFSVFDAVIWALGISGILEMSQGLENILSYIHLLLLFPFHIFLFGGLSSLSKELSFTKGVKRAVFASSVTVTYYIIYIVSLLKIQNIGIYLAFLSFVMFFVNFITTESAVYCCYRAITTDEAEKKEEEKLKRFQNQFGRGKKNKK